MGKHTVKVSSKSKPGSTGSAIAHLVRDGEDVVVSCLGSKSLVVAMKSLMTARKYLLLDHIDISVTPSYCLDVVEIDGELQERSMLHLDIVKHELVSVKPGL